MLKYYKRKFETIGENDEKNTSLPVIENIVQDTTRSSGEKDTSLPISENIEQDRSRSYSKKKLIDSEDIEEDPGKRPSILDHHPNVRDLVRRKYIQMGPCQPTEHDFPLKEYGDKRRKFNVQWYKKYTNWLEYSIDKNRAYCLCCYLFRPCHRKQSGGDSFVGTGFNSWKNSETLKIHVGGPASAHNQAWRDLTAMKNQKQNIENIVSKRSEVSRNEYRTRLTTSVNCVRLLLEQGLSFRGDDESETSMNQGNFLRVLRFLADHNPEVRSVTLGNANKNLKLTSPGIQKDIIHACASETVKAIFEDFGSALFSILVDESHDIYMKEQMAVVLRYVDKRGIVVERFVGIEHVSSTTALTLKNAIDKLLSRHKLSISRLRGQGYDGASNMKGQFNGLKTPILKENSCAFYIHCFAHQLQLALVYVAKKHVQVASFFSIVSSVLNTIGVSAKRCDILQDRQDSLIKEAIDSGELESGRGLNQQTSLKRFGDTRWGSHYGTLIRMLSMFSAIVESLETIIDDDTLNSDQRGDANNLILSIQSFEFVFNLHLMIDVLGSNHALCMGRASSG